MLAGLGAAASAQTGISELEAVSKPPEIDRTTQTDDIKFRTDGYARMTVPVRLQGTGPYRFLVDTGADRTSISRELAGRLGLRQGAPGRLHSVTGESDVATATLDDLQLSRKQVRVIDAPLLAGEHIGADGILGVDSLRSQRILFDFRKRTLSLVPAIQKVIPAEEGTIVVQARERNGRLIVTRATADGQTMSVVIDTGAQVSIGNEALKRRLQAQRSLRRSGPVELQSVTGEKIVGDYMFLNRLEIGGLTLENLAIVFVDAHTFAQLGLKDRPALLLGMNALRAFDKVSIDFARKQFRVMLPESGEVRGPVMALNAQTTRL